MDRGDKKIQKVKCWEIFACNQEECPAYKSKNHRCWLFSGTHCYDQIQGKFIEKMEMCLSCKVFKTNMDLNAMKRTMSIADKQFKQFRRLVDQRDREMETISMELALGLSETFEALKKIASGDPTVRVTETSEIELISKLKQMVNLTAEEIGEIVNQSHDFAIDLAEHFDVLHRVSQGDLNAKVTGSSQVELSQSLKRVTNEMIESISREINERKSAEENLGETLSLLNATIESTTDGILVVNMDGKIISFNQKFVKMWQIPEFIIESGDDDKALAFVLNQLKDPDTFITKVRELYAQPEAQSYDVLEFKDGRIFERYSHPQRIGNTIVGRVWSSRDITERKHSEEELRKSEERYRSFVRNFQGIAFRRTLDFKPIFFLGAVEQITGYDTEEFINGQIKWEHMIHPDDMQAIAGDDELRTNPDYSLEREYRIICKDGQTRWVHEIIWNVCDKFGKLIRVEGAVYDITDRKKAEERIRYMAFHDDLTDLPNRYFFKDRLSQAIASAEKSNRLVAILFFDLDNFKRVNDTLGHEAGDILLKSVAYRLVEYVRKSDVLARFSFVELETNIARLGGDEFTILLTEIKDIQDAAKVAQRVLDLFKQPFKIDIHDIFITTSIGISLYPHDGKDVETIIKNADAAMYHAKAHGRNNFQFYSEYMNVAAIERFALENDLRKALDNGELLLHYQPQLDIKTGRIIGLEALIRWMHSEKGMLLPETFIPLAEETGLIIPIGEWVLYTACAQNKAWQTAGFAEMHVTVNISSVQFRQKNFAEIVDQALNDTGLDSQYLELELTESILMENMETAVTALNKLKSMGIRLSIDDFGTGYSSLSYLKRFPIDTLKIDQSFVRDITNDPDDKAIINAIIALARSLNLKVIAEGVETVQQLAYLYEQGSDGMQGFLFSHPIPADSMTKLLEEGKRLKTWCFSGQNLLLSNHSFGQQARNVSPSKRQSES